MISIPKITLLQLLSFSEARPTKRGIVERELGKKLPNLVKIEEENRETNKNILALWGSYWVSNDHVAGDKPLNLMMGNWRRKPDKGSINEKPLELNEEM